MSQSHLALLVIDLDRLAVCSVGSASRSVSGVTNGDLSLREFTKDILVEDFVYESQILVGRKDSVVVNDYTAALLTSVL